MKSGVSKHKSTLEHLVECFEAANYDSDIPDTSHSNRTLSNVGERFTVAATQSMNKLTHSYTIQPILTTHDEWQPCRKAFCNSTGTQRCAGTKTAANYPLKL